MLENLGGNPLMMIDVFCKAENVEGAWAAMKRNRRLTMEELEKQFSDSTCSPESALLFGKCRLLHLLAKHQITQMRLPHYSSVLVP